MRRAEGVVLLGFLSAHCAGARPRVEDPSEIPAAPSTTSAARAQAEAPDEGPSALTRAVLAEAVRGGFGSFLSAVTVSPVLRGGRFVGFRLDEARHLRRWNAAGLPLRAGDVVTRVNGRSIERPGDALAVFQGLIAATEIRVEVLRDGAPQELRLAVQP